MKLRFANPGHLVDLNFVPGTSYVKEENGTLRFGIWRGGDRSISACRSQGSKTQRAVFLLDVGTCPEQNSNPTRWPGLAKRSFINGIRL